jgi:hypothetical protein
VDSKVVTWKLSSHALHFLAMKDPKAHKKFVKGPNVDEYNKNKYIR